MPRHIESRIQENCVRWFRLQYPQLAKNLIAIPNGGWRGKIEAGIMKAEGVMPGAADLFLFVPNSQYHGMGIEMKTPTGRQQETQKQWQAAIEAQGYKYHLCRGFDDFMEVIQNYLKG